MFRERWIASVLMSGMDWTTIGAVLMFIPYVRESGAITASDDVIVMKANGSRPYLLRQVELARATPFIDGTRAVIP